MFDVVRSEIIPSINAVMDLTVVVMIVDPPSSKDIVVEPGIDTQGEKSASNHVTVS